MPFRVTSRTQCNSDSLRVRRIQQSESYFRLRQRKRTSPLLLSSERVNPRWIGNAINRRQGLGEQAGEGFDGQRDRQQEYSNSSGNEVFPELGGSADRIRANCGSRGPTYF